LALIGSCACKRELTAVGYRKVSNASGGSFQDRFGDRKRLARYVKGLKVETLRHQCRPALEQQQSRRSVNGFFE
jgi:hypothetical protein